MTRILLWALWLLPVGWCREGSAAKVWRNRRKGRGVVLLGDVAANLGEIVHAAVYRVPEGAEFVRGKDGLIAGTFNRRRGGTEGEGRR